MSRLTAQVACDTCRLSRQLLGSRLYHSNLGHPGDVRSAVSPVRATIRPGLDVRLVRPLPIAGWPALQRSVRMVSSFRTADARRRALLDVQSARISAQRIDELMAADEDAHAYPAPSDPSSILQLKSASFDWPSATLDELPVPALSDITVAIARGQLVMIDGKVGSAKSALARALIGELELVSGSVAMVAATAYVAQTPSIWGMTLRDNIVYGRAYDAKRYRATVEACALDVDIASLPYGDQTRLGERGVTLSGGTKMRVALARALYSDAELMILECVVPIAASY